MKNCRISAKPSEVKMVIENLLSFTYCSCKYAEKSLAIHLQKELLEKTGDALLHAIAKQD